MGNNHTSAMLLWAITFVPTMGNQHSNPSDTFAPAVNVDGALKIEGASQSSTLLRSATSVTANGNVKPKSIDPSALAAMLGERLRAQAASKWFVAAHENAPQPRELEVES